MCSHTLIIGRDRRSRCAGAGRGGGRCLALDARRRRGARSGRRVARLLRLGADDLRLDWRRLGVGDGLGRLSRRLHFQLHLGRRHHLRIFLRRSGRDLLVDHLLLLDRLGRRGVGLIHQPVRRALQRRRLRRRRYRCHVHHDRRQGNAGLRLRQGPVHADCDQCGMRGQDRCRRYAPAAQYGLVRCIMERERVHGGSAG